MKRIYLYILFVVFSFTIAKAQSSLIDLTFETDFDFREKDQIHVIRVQPDGKILVGGQFLFEGTKSRIHNILRLNADGTLDAGFNAESSFFDYGVTAILIQPDGKLLVFGFKTKSNGIYSYRIVLLNKDGSLDHPFDLQPTGGLYHISAGTNGEIIAVHNPNTSFKTSFLKMLNSDITFNTSFKLASYEFNNYINSYTLRPDGKMIVGGYFKKIKFLGKEFSYNYLVQFNGDGSIDTAFVVDKRIEMPIGISRIVLQDDDKLLLHGSFYLDKGIHAKGLIRLNTDGKLDTTFNFINSFVIPNLYLQKDGKVIIGSRRINQDGSLDSTFVPGFNKEPTGAYYYDKNRILMTGPFNSFDSHLRSKIARLFIEADSSNLGLNSSGVSEINFSVSPNPSTGLFVIKSHSTIKNILVTDLVGKEVLRIEPTSKEVNIDLTGKSNGVYFIKIFSNNKSVSKKILKLE